MVGEGHGIQESWEGFGDNLGAFLSREETSLRDKTYNVILGFTRGGAILATALASQLGEKFPEVYSVPWAGAIRTIPNGIHKKVYDRPDFVMGSPCAEEDLRDLKELIRELSIFRKTHKLDRVSVLLVDDNLTGSTRMKFFKDSLADLGFIDIELLAYARNPRIEVPIIEYFVRTGAIGANEYLIMPWHDVHEPNGILVKGTGAKLSLTFHNRKRQGIHEIEKTIATFLPPSRQPNRMESDGRILLVKRGETYIQMRTVEDRLTIKFPGNLYYPPKRCLSKKGPSFGDLSLCSFGAAELTGITCRACSVLSCSQDILDILERHIEMEFLGVDLDLREFGDGEKEHIKDALERWMRSERRDPSDLRFFDLGRFLDLDEEIQLKLRDDLEETHGSWLAATMETLGASWIVSIGDKVVRHGTDLADVPSLEDMMPLAKEHNLVPFLFIRLLPTEEGVPWSQCPPVQQREDWYPTIPIRVSSVKRDDGGSLTFVADFDTGDPYIHLDGDLLYNRGIVPRHNFFNRNTSQESHVGIPFKYYLAPVRLEVLDGDRTVATVPTQVLCVLEWAHSPFVHPNINPDRTALVGRQVFRFMEVRTILDGGARTTRVERC